MSSIPVYAINTSCRSAECLGRWPASTAGQYKTKPARPPNLQSVTQQGRPRSYSNSSDGQAPPLTPPMSPDTKIRSSSLTQLDRQSLSHQSAPPVKSPLTTQSYSFNRERIMDSLNIFN